MNGGRRTARDGPTSTVRRDTCLFLAVFFSVYFTLSSEYCEAFSKDGLQATVFGLAGFAFGGGLMVASAASSAADTYGMRTTFLGAGVLFAVAALPALRVMRAGSRAKAATGSKALV